MNHQFKRTLFGSRLLTSIVVSLLALALASVAQSAAHSQRGPSGMDRLTKRLELTDAQKPQVQAILAESSAKRRTAMDKPFRDMSADEREALSDEMTAIRKETDTELAKVLTAEQMAELAELREERLEALRERRQRYVERRDAGMDQLAKRLGLTDAQQTQVKAIMAESSAKRRAAIDKPFRDMSEEEREALGDEMTAISDETDGKLAGVLSAEQMAELGEMREERLEALRERRRRFLENSEG